MTNTFHFNWKAVVIGSEMICGAIFLRRHKYLCLVEKPPLKGGGSQSSEQVLRPQALFGFNPPRVERLLMVSKNKLIIITTRVNVQEGYGACIGGCLGVALGP